MIIPVTEETERIERYEAEIKLSYPAIFFQAHLQGIEQFAGKKVLEIGGVRNPNMTLVNYFMNMGAEYRTVGLEDNKANYPYVLSVRDFRDIRNELYDLIISMGVFEQSGIDRSIDGNDFRSIYNSHQRDLQKLLALTKEGGINIIGTISDPCFFTNDEIQEAGFKLQHRIKQFASLGSESHEARRAYKDSELLVIVK